MRTNVPPRARSVRLSRRGGNNHTKEGIGKYTSKPLFTLLRVMDPLIACLSHEMVAEIDIYLNVTAVHTHSLNKRGDTEGGNSP